MKKNDKEITYIEPSSYFPKEILDKIFGESKLSNNKSCQIKHVQAFIDNISFPKTIDELKWFVFEHKCFNVEDILYNQEEIWTAPSWAKIGDIVFFMHTKTANSIISRLKTELNRDKENFDKSTYDILQSWLSKGSDLYKKYGGKIFAIAIVTGKPTYENLDDEENLNLHWKSRIYADMKIIAHLEEPLDISEFNDFIFISRQSAITPIVGSDFIELRNRLSKKNILPKEIWNIDTIPMPLTKINKDNWYTLPHEFRNSFLLEKQFRHFYVDYLLQELGDQKKFFVECRCKKTNHPDTFVDNVILFNKKFLPIEVKLAIDTQVDMKKQARQYCNNYEIILESKTGRTVYHDNIYSNFIVIIDTEQIYLYNNQNNTIQSIYNLDNIVNHDDIKELRKKLNYFFKK